MAGLITQEIYSTTGTLTDAEQIKFNEESSVSTALSAAISRVSTLENTAFSSGRAFVRFNDGFTIDRDNLSTYEDKNIIYTAKNDKATTIDTAPDVHLPNDEEILASGETYPIAFEFTHLGGTAVSTEVNLLRLFVDGVLKTTLLRDQVAVVVKEAAGEDYIMSSATFDPNDTVLPSGVFNLKLDTPIDNASNIASELSSVTIVAGDAYVVTTGGTWSGLTIPDDSVIVALVNSASLIDSPDNSDWLLLDNPRVNAESAAFLANWERDGIQFNGNRNIQVDPSNVLEANSMATGVPIVREIGANNTGTINSSIRYDGVPLQISDIVGGRLQLGIEFQVTSSTGFSPSWTSVSIQYPGGVQFDFDVNGAPLNGQYISEMTIPTIDYSSAIVQDATVILYYDFNGVSFRGSYTITHLVNASKGRLSEAVIGIAATQASKVEMRVNTTIDALRGAVDAEDASLEAINDRISPYTYVKVVTPETHARYLDSTGSDSYPSSIDSMDSVSASNPRFTAGDTSLFVAIRPGTSGAIKDVTDGTIVNLDDSEATVEVGESLNASDGFVYFVYRVTGIVSGNVYEVETVSREKVVGWQNDIDTLYSDIDRIDVELDHAVLNLSEDVVNVLQNEVTVDEEDTPVISSSAYNNQLGTTPTQSIFYESTQVPSGSGVQSSAEFKDTLGTNKYGNKLVYIPRETTFANQAYLSSDLAGTSTELVRYIDGTFFAKVYVEAIPEGTATSTIYPAPNNLVSGAGIWINIPAFSLVNGVPTLLADEVFFTRNVPSTSVPVNVQYRGHANGNVFGVGSVVLPANQDVVSVTLDAGGEQATLQILRRNGQIRASITEHLSTGLPTISDVDVILSYTESRAVPSTQATVREVALEYVSSGTDTVFGVRESSDGKLILIGSTREVDTNYSFDTLFGVDGIGKLFVTVEGSVFFDYEDLVVTPQAIVDLENHSVLPQYGLFTTSYTHQTVVELATQLTVLDAGGNVRNVGAILADLLNRVGNLE